MAEAHFPDSPKDVCYCGDYRHQHVDGKGACRLNGLGHGYAGYQCHAFRLSRRDPAQEADLPTGAQ